MDRPVGLRDLVVRQDRQHLGADPHRIRARGGRTPDVDIARQVDLVLVLVLVLGGNGSYFLGCKQDACSWSITSVSDAVSESVSIRFHML